MQLMPRQPQLRMHGKAIEPLHLCVTDVAIGHNGQRDDTSGGLRAIGGIAAQVLPFRVLLVLGQLKMSFSHDFWRLPCGLRPCL